MTAIQSPSLHLEWDKFVQNVETIAGHLSSQGIRWRPHVKSHCSGRIATYLTDHGAAGVTVATLQQARTMVESRIPSVLLTTPVGRPGDWTEIGELQERVEVMVAIDSLDHLASLEAAAPGKRVPLLVELDLGLGRTGARSIETALELAAAASAGPHSRFEGFMGYEGHVFRTWPETVKQAAYENAIGRLGSLVAEARRLGLDVGIVSGGGTGSLFVDAPQHVFDESQAGGGVFMDMTYLEDFHVPHLQPALFIDTTVIALHPPSSVVIDAGFKLFGASKRLPVPVDSALEVGAVSAHLSMVTGDVEPLRIGSRLRLIPGYSDATAFGFNELVVDGSETTLPLHASHLSHSGS